MGKSIVKKNITFLSYQYASDQMLLLKLSLGFFLNELKNLMLSITKKYSTTTTESEIPTFTQVESKNKASLRRTEFLMPTAT